MKNQVNLHAKYSLQVYVLQSKTYNISNINIKYTIFGSTSRIICCLIDLHAWLIFSCEHVSAYLMTSLGFQYEKLSGFHLCILQLVLLTKMQFFFGSMTLLHCSWFFFYSNHFRYAWIKFLAFKAHISCHRHITRGVKFPCSTWRMRSLYVFFSLFGWFHKLWRVLYFHIVWRLGWKPLHLKMLSDLLARAHEHWYQVWLPLPAAVECWRY